MTQFSNTMDSGALIVRNGADIGFCKPCIDPEGELGSSIASAGDVYGGKAP